MESRFLYFEDDGGAILRIEAYQYPGTKVLDLYSPVIEESFYGHEWQRLSVTGTIPLECEHYYYEVSFGLRNATGTAWFDCMQLEKGDSVNDYNALSNSDFSSASDWKDQNGNAIALNNDKVTLNGLGGEPAQVAETESEDESEPESEYITDETYMVTETETFENDVIEETDTYGHIVSTKQGFVTRTYSRTYGIEPTEETEETTEDPTQETTESTTEETTEEPTETTTATESESEEDDGHYLIDEEITAEEIDTTQPHMQ